MSNERNSQGQQRRGSKPSPEADAEGQSEQNHKGGSNDGIASANPRVLSGETDGDATFPVKNGR